MQAQELPDADGFVVAAPADAIRTDQITAVEIAGRPLILTRWQGRVYAFSARCPHAAGDLSQGTLYRGRIDCPGHGYRFDVATGRVLWPADEICRLKQYSVKEEDGVIKVKV
ncbi:MAG: Rieske (2Fe-2S) protein [Chloroflexi bacterium]|nr:Rieske (2Fe-2S) protein [Chloroflexota bacterium]